MYTALRLQKKLKRELRRRTVEVIVVDPRSYMTYQPFLPEAAAGSLEPRHVVVPLRRLLSRCEVLNGRVTAGGPRRRVARVTPNRGEAFDLTYEHIVLAPGSIARTLPIPGLKEMGIGFKQVEEAITLRNQVLEKLDIAAAITDRELQRCVLTFVFVGGGYAGIEALAELEDMARYATRYYEDISPADLHFVLVEATGRILPEVGEDLGRYTVEELRKRNIDVRLNTRLESCVGGHIVLSDGDEFDAETLVWTAGVKASPMLTNTDLPVDDKGRLRCRTDLRVEGEDGAWAAGDGAAVPDLTNPGQMCSSERPARRTPGQAARHQHRPGAARAHAVGLHPQARRLGRLAGPAQGGCAGLRHQAAGLPGVVHASDLPHEPGAHVQPEGAGGPRLDAGAVLQARGRVVGLAAGPSRRVLGGITMSHCPAIHAAFSSWSSASRRRCG